MSSSSRLRFLALRWVLAGAALALVPAAPGWAGKFNKPAPDWGRDAAKIPTPANVKDASAVILFHEYLETVDGSGRATEREREAIRVLKPQGRDESCGVSYDIDEKVNYFRVWTIGADGKEYPAQEADYADVGSTQDTIMLSSYKFRGVRPPAMDVGAVLICESEKLAKPYMQEAVWNFQGEIPAATEAFELYLPPGRGHEVAWHRYGPAKAEEVSANHWRWELKDVPALTLRGVPSHPEWQALAGRMSVQWGEAAVDGADAQWKAIGEWVTTLEANRPDPSPEITAKVQGLIAGAPDFYTKLSRITESVQKEIRYFVVMRGIGGYQANRAADIFRNRYGDCKDKTTLLISMLQVAGIHAYYVPVDDRRDVVDPAEPSLTIGNHMITAIEIPAEVIGAGLDPRLRAVVKGKDGKQYLIFDPTNQTTPVGNLPSYEQGGYGLLSAGPESQVIALPVLGPEANGTEQKGQFTLTADGALTGSVDTSHSGPEGGDFREFLIETDAKKQREDWELHVAHDVPGVVLDSFQYVQPAELDKPLEFHYKLTAKQYAHMAGPLLLVRPRVVGSDALPSLEKTDTPRTVPIDLQATGHWHDSYDIQLPEGYVVDEMPDPVNVEMDFASYHSTISAKGKTLHYERDYKLTKVELPPEKAPDFRRLEGMILADEKATVVLKKE
jgi:hypothetical protein